MPDTAIQKKASPMEDTPDVEDVGESIIPSSTVFRRLLGSLRDKFPGRSPAPSLKETLSEVIEEHETVAGQPSHDEEKRLLRKVLAFNELAAGDVMTPRADIVAVEYGVTLDELKKVITTESHTRMPVYRGTLDDVAGFIHAKDVLQALCFGAEIKMRTIIRQALFVPPSMPVTALLLKMRLSHVHMALVVDEYGGTSGLVTLEDLMEELVGEIEDEHDSEDDVQFVRLGNNLYEASARISIEDLERQLGVTLKDTEGEDEFDTLGGLMIFLLGHVPARGELASHSAGIEFEVTDADMRRVKRVLIRRKGQAQP